MSKCLFCAIGKGTEPSACIYEDDVCKVFLDIFPASKGHLLIIPKEHVVTYDELKGAQREHISRVTQLLSKAAMTSGLNPQGYNIQINNGVAANQHVPHLHIHIIPRYKGDLIKVMAHFLMQAPGIFIGRKKLTDLEKTAEILREALTKVSAQ